MPSAGVTLYLSWILFSGLAYTEKDECHGDMKPNKYATMIWMAFMFVGIGYFCLTNYSHIDQNENEQEIKDEENPDDDIEEKQDKDEDEEANVTNITMVRDTGNDDIDSDEKEQQGIIATLCNPSDGVQAKNLHFHVLMFFGSLYIMTVLCRWETDATGSSNDGRSDSVVTANIISHWGVVLLYLITLVAPLMCPGRFTYDDIDD